MTLLQSTLRLVVALTLQPDNLTLPPPPHKGGSALLRGVWGPELLGL